MHTLPLPSSLFPPPSPLLPLPSSLSPPPSPLLPLPSSLSPPPSPLLPLPLPSSLSLSLLPPPSPFLPLPPPSPFLPLLLPPLLGQITSYLEDLKELKAHTPLEHVDYIYLQETIDELEITQKVLIVSWSHPHCYSDLAPPPLL